jgi:hypothetical protein
MAFTVQTQGARIIATRNTHHATRNTNGTIVTTSLLELQSIITKIVSIQFHTLPYI